MGSDDIVGAVRPNWFMSAIEEQCQSGCGAKLIAHTIGTLIANSSEVELAIEKTLNDKASPVGPQMSYRIAHAISKLIVGPDEPDEPEIWPDAD